jgi:hypothetical protein
LCFLGPLFDQKAVLNKPSSQSNALKRGTNMQQNVTRHESIACSHADGASEPGGVPEKPNITVFLAKIYHDVALDRSRRPLIFVCHHIVLQ